MDGGDADGGQLLVALDAATFLPCVSAPGVALVLVTSQHCPPCLAYAATYKTSAATNVDVVFCWVNADQHSDLVQALSITSVPTLLVFRDGILLLSRPGPLPLATLNGLIEKVRGLDMSTVGQKNA
jgi:thioredoxin 1